jgi:hypothetical protein
MFLEELSVTGSDLLRQEALSITELAGSKLGFS